MYELRVIAACVAPYQFSPPHDHWHTGIAPASIVAQFLRKVQWRTLALQFRFLQRPVPGFVREMGHWTALSFRMMIERRDQMPFDGG